MPIAIGSIPDSGQRASPSPQDVRNQLARLLNSPLLEASDRRRAFLRYIVEETLQGRGDRLKGFSIAVSVFGRDETFNSSADPVVRLEARRLRRDLDSYYVFAGRTDPVRIFIPKGAYVPSFDWHNPPADRAVPPVNAAPDSAPLLESGDGSADAAPPPAPAAAPRVSRRVRVGVLAALVLGLMVVAGAAGWLMRPEAPPVSYAGDGEPAVAVLPFQLSGTDPNGHFLAAGIREELIGHLVRFPGFRVYTQPLDAAPDPDGSSRAGLARNLGAAYTISGSLGIEGDDARLAVRLDNAATGEVIWAATYRRRFTAQDLMRLEEELAGDIAGLLAQPYGVVNQDIEARFMPEGVSKSSYICVMRGHLYRRSFSAAAFPPVLTCLEEAVARDPAYPDALAMLGWLYLDAGRFEFLGAATPQDHYEKALAVASRALELDRRNVLALKALGAINHYMGRYAEGERLSREAVALNPHDPDALAQLGWRLAVRGNFAEGIPLLKTAIARSVNPPGWYNHLIAIDLYLKGEYAEMLQVSQKAAAKGLGVTQALIAIAGGALGRPDIVRPALAELAGYGPLSRDPAAYFRRHGATSEIIEALMGGLQHAREVADE